MVKRQTLILAMTAIELAFDANGIPCPKRITAGLQGIASNKGNEVFPGKTATLLIRHLISKPA
jgi:hypothetical protein